MQNPTLELLLLESRLRQENRLAALKLGLFGRSAEEIRERLGEYDAAQQPVIDDACNTITPSA
jgi:hypothetical protein